MLQAFSPVVDINLCMQQNVKQTDSLETNKLVFFFLQDCEFGFAWHNHMTVWQYASLPDFSVKS